MSTRTILPAVKFTGRRNPFLIALTLALLLVTGSIILMSSDDRIGPGRAEATSAPGPVTMRILGSSGLNAASASAFLTVAM